MQIERQISVALMGISLAVVVPQMLPALRGDLSHVSAGGLLIGNLLAALGLFLWSLMNLSREQSRMWRRTAGLLLGAMTLAFAGGAAWIAVSLGASRAIVPALAALLPLFGFGFGAYTAMKN